MSWGGERVKEALEETRICSSSSSASLVNMGPFRNWVQSMAVAAENPKIPGKLVQASRDAGRSNRLTWNNWKENSTHTHTHAHLFAKPPLSEVLP